MNHHPTAAPPTRDPDPREVRRVMLSGFLGNTIEFYDFLLYGTASAIVFSRIFFSDLSPALGTIASFATLAAGYVARPLGGIIFGHFGDRLGRKKILLITMTMMGISSGLIGVLPTYDTIGVVAPALLLLLRLVQGIAVGGEWGGAGLMAAEHAAPGRRGFVTGIPQAGLPAGAVLATLAFAAVSALPRDAFLSWGWRLPFLSSFLLLGVGLYVRLRVSESPVFRASSAQAAVPRVPVLDLVRRYPANLVRGILAGVGALAIQGVFSVFLISYAVGRGYAQPTVLNVIAAGSAVGVVTIPAWSALSDRVGRKPVFLLGSLLAAVMAYPAFAMVNSGSVALLLLMQVVMFGIVITAMNGPMVALLSELFSTDVRYTGVSVSYQLATTLGGGFGPLIAASLVQANGGSSAPVSLLLLVAAVLSGVAVLTFRESRGSDLRVDPVTVRAISGSGRSAPVIA